jgi:hypothetical protein
MGDNRIDCIADGADVAQVCLVKSNRMQGISGKPIGERPAYRFGDIDEGNFGTLPGEALDNGCADAGAAAGYQHAAIP